MNELIHTQRCLLPSVESGLLAGMDLSTWDETNPHLLLLCLCFDPMCSALSWCREPLLVMVGCLLKEVGVS